MNSKYDSYRRWFNQLFSLSVDGKFKGLYYLLQIMDVRHFEHFLAVFKKTVVHGRGRYGRALPLVFSKRVCGHTLKFYSR